MVGAMQPGEKEDVDADALTFGQGAGLDTHFQVAFTFDQLPQLEAERERDFRGAIGALADGLKAHPKGIRLKPNSLRTLTEICSAKGTALPTILALVLSRTVSQENDIFRILTEAEVRTLLARKRPQN